MEAAPAGGPAKLSFRSTGRGKVRCGDGSSFTFDGPSSYEFDGSSLPVSCMVDIEGKKGAFQVSGTATVTCNVSGTDVVCN